MDVMETRPGSISVRESYVLSQLAQGIDVLEIGSFKGFSTVCLLTTAKSVTAIDTFHATAMKGIEVESMDTLPEYLQATEQGRESGRLTTIIGNANDILPYMEGGWDLIFHDGPHDYQNTLTQLLHCKRMNPHYIVVHDFKRPGYEEVEQACNKAGLNDSNLVKLEETLAMFQLR